MSMHVAVAAGCISLEHESSLLEVFELATRPGLTETSLLPLAAAEAAGQIFTDPCTQLAECVIEDPS